MDANKLIGKTFAYKGIGNMVYIVVVQALEPKGERYDADSYIGKQTLIFPNGDEMLNRIKESLTRYFSANRSDFPEGLRDIEDDFNHYPGDPYPTIAVNDVGDPDRMIEFYVTGQQ